MGAKSHLSESGERKKRKKIDLLTFHCARTGLVRICWYKFDGYSVDGLILGILGSDDGDDDAGDDDEERGMGYVFIVDSEDGETEEGEDSFPGSSL